ncbi:MAG: hypothetical protein J7L54_04490 [Elusimicrobia bacterium]|nr:hypothetical protein [Elusimicrobiota bacterium]
MIEDYSFGKIVIDGREYISDVIVLGNRVVSSWWRKEGHKLFCRDIKEIFDFNPEAIVVGCGSPGLMKVQADVFEKCETEGIEIFAKPTASAVKIFNFLHEKKKTAGCFHLTC